MRQTLTGISIGISASTSAADVEIGEIAIVDSEQLEPPKLIKLGSASLLVYGHDQGECLGCKSERELSCIPRACPHKLHLVLDNLNTHREKSLTTTFGAQAGHWLWRRFTVHYTPKHGSWLNPAELEASLWSRQCLGRQRVASLTELRERTSAWNRWANRTKLKIDWRFSTADARRVFHYQRIATYESKH